MNLLLFDPIHIYGKYSYNLDTANKNLKADQRMSYCTGRVRHWRIGLRTVDGPSRRY